MCRCLGTGLRRRAPARSVDDGGTVNHRWGGNHLLACILSFSRHDHRTAANNLVIYILDWRRIIGRIGLYRPPRRVHYRDIRVEKLRRLMIEWRFGVAAAGIGSSMLCLGRNLRRSLRLPEMMAR